MFSERSVHLITSCTKGKNHQGHVWPTLDIDPKQTPDDAAYACDLPPRLDTTLS